MMGAQVGADWAWIGVESGAGIGYRILATSSDEIDFGPFIGRYVPGAPSYTMPQDAPDAPPWITFGPRSPAVRCAGFVNDGQVASW